MKAPPIFVFKGAEMNLENRLKKIKVILEIKIYLTCQVNAGWTKAFLSND